MIVFCRTSNGNEVSGMEKEICPFVYVLLPCGYEFQFLYNN